MGMYTEIYINVDLKEDTPEDIIDALKVMCGESDTDSAIQGKPERWRYLFNNGSYYTPSTSCANLTYDHISKQWSLLGKGDIKNYENEIEQFFEWIMPYIDGKPGDFIGYTRYEEYQQPELIFKSKPF